jgi:hypothetical protein
MADGTAQCCCTSGFTGANCENAGKNLVMWKYIGKIELNTGKPLYRNVFHIGLRPIQQPSDLLLGQYEKHHVIIL